MSYLKDELLPLEKEKARNLRFKVAKFVLLDDVLYKKNFSLPYLRCLTLDESNYVMRDVHEEACENHSGARSLVHKLVCIRYYWPSMQADAKSYVQACDRSQHYSNVLRQPSKHLNLMTVVVQLLERSLFPFLLVVWWLSWKCQSILELFSLRQILASPKWFLKGIQLLLLMLFDMGRVTSLAM